MKFSIIIPAYNADETIETCLRSCAFEPDTEVVVSVEDNCTDGTWDVIQALRFPSVTHMMERWPNHERKYQPHGPGVMRNAALNGARGDWIIFLDADDQLAPGALQKLSDFINAHPDVDT